MSILARHFPLVLLVSWVLSVPAAEVPKEDGIYAILETPKGDVICELAYREAPLTATNFIGLAEGTINNSFRKPGEPYFDGLTFHRVVKDFVVQGGDPKGDGEGGPGYEFTDEFSPRLRHDRIGILSMANDGPNTNGSQFFITLRDTNRLNYLHSVFGRVVAGEDVLGKIEQGDKIQHVKIVRVGDAAKKFQTDVIMFEILKKRAQLVPPDPVKPEGLKYFVDETGTLPDFRVKNFNYKLANYDKFRRERIAVRLVGKPDLMESEVPGLVKILDPGSRSGLSAVIAYHAPTDKWFIKATKRLEEILAPGGSADSKTVDEKLNELLNRSRELSKEKKLKEAVDAAIDTVMMRLDDAPTAAH